MAAPVYPAWVTRWVSGQWRQKKRPPAIRPTRPLVLANKVANRREQAGEATCITEMSVMMACWKQNDFSDTACTEEIRMFYDCVAKAEYVIVLNEGEYDLELLSRTVICMVRDVDCIVNGEMYNVEGAQGSKCGDPVTQGKLNFKQSEQAPEEVSSDHTLCIMCFTKGTADKQLKLESFAKK